MAQIAATPGTGPATLFEKIWRRHVVVDRPDGYTLLYVDRHLIHDGSYFAFKRIKDRGLKFRRPDLAFATPDHYMPTDTRDKAEIKDANGQRMVTSVAVNAGWDRGHHVRHRRSPQWHRACRRSRARYHAAGYHAGLRRQPHLDPWRARLPRVRNRAVRGHARHGHANALAKEAEDDAGHDRRRDCPGHHGKGHHPRHHRSDRRRWRHGLRARVCGQRHP